MKSLILQMVDGFRLLAWIEGVAILGLVFSYLAFGVGDWRAYQLEAASLKGDLDHCQGKVALLEYKVKGWRGR